MVKNSVSASALFQTSSKAKFHTSSKATRATMIIVLLCIAPLFSHAIPNQNIKLFEHGSLKTIEDQRSGLPFMLVLWSIDCPPCLHELETLKQLRHAQLPQHLVLISTDSSESIEEIKNLIDEFELNAYEHWIFSDSMPERLRFQIDPTWYGELPRAYFYNKNGDRVHYSGVLNQDQLNRWLDLISLP